MGRRFCKFTDDDFMIMADMRERGFTQEQIARGFNCSANNIHWHCLKQGIEGSRLGRTQPPAKEPTQVKRGNHVVRRFTEAEDKILREMSERGAKVHEMAKALNRRPNSIDGRLMTIARHDERADNA